MKQKTKTTTRRRGFSLLEIFVAATILAAMLTISVQMLGAMAAQHRAIQVRQMAIQETANVMERLFAQSWDKFTPEGVKNMELSEEFRQAVPGGRLEITVDELPDKPEAKRITVLVRWPGDAHQPDRLQQLVAFKYRPAEQ